MTAEVTPLRGEEGPRAESLTTRQRVFQLVALSDPSLSKAFGAALWAAAREVATFFEAEQMGASFTRRYVSDHIPTQVHGGGVVRSTAKWIASLFGAADDDADQQETFASPSAEPTALESARGHYLRTYDAERLAALVSQSQSDDGIEADFNLIVTDRELSPADAAMRYVLWWYDDKQNRAAVVSTVAMDPAFWRMPDVHRAATVKHRVRVACLWNVLHFLGGSACDNQRCFLNGLVNSYTDLDRMTHLGREHPDLEPLIGRGFERSERRPEDVQSIRDDLLTAEESTRG